jgi:hypothetical protein
MSQSTAAFWKRGYRVNERKLLVLRDVDRKR